MGAVQNVQLQLDGREPVPKLRVLPGEGVLSEQTFHRWRNQYGGMKADEARRLKELEVENTRLKRLVADQALDMAILKEANFYLGKHQARREGGAS